MATAESCTGGLDRRRVHGARRLERLVRARRRHLLERRQDRAARRRRRRSSRATARSAREVARAMADGMLARSPARFAVAVTGIAGPDGGTPAKPVGTVWIATAARGGAAEATLLNASGDRAAVRERSVRARSSCCSRGSKSTPPHGASARRSRRRAARAGAPTPSAPCARSAWCRRAPSARRAAARAASALPTDRAASRGA